jgi:hypothetical protein
MAIVGLVGFIGAGKGTVADVLVERHDYFKESFANSVKDATAAIFGWSRTLLEGDTPESRAWREQDDKFWSEKLGKPFSPRLALQLMGTEAGRDVFHPDLWVHTVLRRCQNAPWNNYVIADVRFPNEVKAIHDAGGIIVRVRRGPEPEWYNVALKVNKKNNYYGMAEKYPDVHFSEWAWIGSEIDFEINNNRTQDDLIERVDSLVNLVYNNDLTNERG